MSAEPGTNDYLADETTLPKDALLWLSGSRKERASGPTMAGQYQGLLIMAKALTGLTDAEIQQQIDDYENQSEPLYRIVNVDGGYVVTERPMTRERAEYWLGRVSSKFTSRSYRLEKVCCTRRQAPAAWRGIERQCSRKEDFICSRT